MYRTHLYASQCTCTTSLKTIQPVNLERHEHSFAARDCCKRGLRSRWDQPSTLRPEGGQNLVIHIELLQQRHSTKSADEMHLLRSVCRPPFNPILESQPRTTVPLVCCKSDCCQHGLDNLRNRRCNLQRGGWQNLVFIHIYICIYIEVYIYICMYVYVYVCVYIYIYIPIPALV